MALKKIKIARVSTVKFAMYTQLYNQLKYLKSSGAHVTVISSSSDNLSDFRQESKEFDFIGVKISREISFFSDLVSLLKLIYIFKKNKFDVVHSITPKAGLLCSIAGWIARVPVRMHTFTGQPWVTMTGWKRKLLIFCDKMICILNTCCYADSYSQKEFLVKSKIGNKSQIKVLGNGSLAGVDLSRFHNASFSGNDKAELLKRLDIPVGSQIVLFVGRVTLDKGIQELFLAFEELALANSRVYLLLVGPLEKDGHELIKNINCSIINQRVRTVGYTNAPEQYMSISDVLCLPSYREGFGTVVIEAASMGVPAVATNIYGLSDAIEDGKTGLLVPVKKYKTLSKTLSYLLDNDCYRAKLSLNAKNRVVECFDSKRVGELVLKEYMSYLN